MNSGICPRQGGHLSRSKHLKSKFMAFDEFLAERIQRIFEEKRVPYFGKKMFGGICYLVNDKMCGGVLKQDMLSTCTSARCVAYEIPRRRSTAGNNSDHSSELKSPSGSSTRQSVMLATATRTLEPCPKSGRLCG